MNKNPKLLVIALSSLLALAGCSTPTNSEESKESEESTSIISSVSDSSVSEGTSSSGDAVSSSDSSSNDAQSSSESEGSSNASSEKNESSSSEARTYSVNVEKDEGVTLTGLEEQYEAGATVTFTLSMNGGFALKEIKAKAGTNEITLTLGEDNTYSFLMPKRGVIITVSSERLSYKLSTGDPGNFIASIKQKKVGATDFTELVTVTETIEDTEEGEEDSEITYKTAEFGATVQVELQNSSEYLLQSVSVNGKAIDLEGQMSFTFVMPAQDTSIRIEKEDMPIAITKVESDHFSLTLYKEDKVTQIDNLVAPYSEVYIKVDPKENNADGRYSIKSLSYSYKNNNGNLVTEDITKSIDDDADGYYHFRAPKYDDLTVTITEYDTTAYTDYSFVGDYLMLDLSNGGGMDKTSFTDGYSLSVQSSGVLSMTKNGNTKECLISSASAKEGEGTANLSSSSSSTAGTFLYDGKTVVGDTYLEGATKTSSYLYAAVKKRNSDDADSLYQVKATQFKIGDITYGVVSFYRDEAIYDNLLIKRESGKNSIDFGVELEMLSATYVSDADASFILSKDGSTLLQIGSQGEGGYGNRILLGAEYGDYLTTDGKTLHLDGVNKATYDEQEFAYTLVDNEVTLTSNSRTIKGTIDLTKKEFTVTSDKETSELPEWAGYRFSGWSQYDSSDNDYSEKFIISFHANELKYDCKCLNGNYEQKDIDYEVTNGNTISGKIYNAANKNGVAVTFTYYAGSSGVGYFKLKGGKYAMYFDNTVFNVYTE